MPIIDVSQKSYRSLVRAAHERGMSIDRFIQHVIENDFKAGNVDKLVEFTADQTTIHQRQITAERRTALSSTSSTIDPSSAFDDLWWRIEESAGKPIATKRGQDFTYEVDTGYMTVVESGARIPRSQFKKALRQWPQSGPSNMRGIYAASIVWAILADDRILDNAA